MEKSSKRQASDVEEQQKDRRATGESKSQASDGEECERQEDDGEEQQETCK